MHMTDQQICVGLTCQGLLVVFPHGHKVLQTGVKLVQNPLLGRGGQTPINPDATVAIWLVLIMIIIIIIVH